MNENFTLWHRPNSRGRWKKIATAAAEPDAWDLAYALMADGSEGDWLVLPVGETPTRAK